MWFSLKGMLILVFGVWDVNSAYDIIDEPIDVLTWISDFVRSALATMIKSRPSETKSENDFESA